MNGDGPLWTVVDALVYLSVGLMLGALLAVIAGRGKLPTIPDTPAELLNLS